MSLHRKLALYSDQESPGNSELDKHVLRLIGRSQPRVGYIPATSDSSGADFRRKADYYATKGVDLITYVDPGAKASGTAWSNLLSCEAIHLAGGNTFSFLSWLRQAGGLPLLAHYVAEGGVLIGESAGAILMTPAIDSASLCGDIRDDPSMDTAGLGLVDFHFWPHFDAETISQAQWQLSTTMPTLYGCPDGAGIVVDGDQTTLFGNVRQCNAATSRSRARDGR